MCVVVIRQNTDFRVEDSRPVANDGRDFIVPTDAACALFTQRGPNPLQVGQDKRAARPPAKQSIEDNCFEKGQAERVGRKNDSCPWS